MRGDQPRLHLRRESEADERAIQFLKELVAATPTQRNWRGILISLLVIGLVSAMIVTCVILLTPPDLGPRIRGHLFNLEDLVQSTYKVTPDNAAWVNDDELAYLDDHGGISVFDARNRTSRVIVSNLTMQLYKAERFIVSPDLKYVILLGKPTKLTEFTGESQCWLLPVQAGLRRRHVTPLRPEPWSVDQSHPALQHVTWVPRGGGDSRGDSALVMVHQGNIIYKDRAPSTDSYWVTKDGRLGTVYHGVPDLLYGDHILRSGHSVWPSPRGGLLLYFTINSTAVEDLQYTEYGTGSEPSYPQVRSVKYPRAGGTNPTLTVTIANVSEPKQMTYSTVLPPSGLADRELYAAGVRWLDESRVSVTWYGRRQNSSYVSVCSAPSWRCQTIYQSQRSGGWVEVTAGPVFSRDRRSALVLDRVHDGSDGLFTQIMMMDILSRSVTQMTHSQADVADILSWGEGFIYYLSDEAGRPGERHLHRVSDHSSPLERHTECLTCPPCPPPTTVSDAARNASDANATCLRYEALFSPAEPVRYALRCLGSIVPRLSVPGGPDAPPITLRNNTALRRAAANLTLSAVRLLAVPVAGGAATVRLHVPPQYRAGDAAAYPLVLRLAVTADLSWRADWPAYLAAQQGLIVADVALPWRPTLPADARPPAAEAVGAAEVEALKTVLAHLTGALEFVSPGRVVALGRGFGGYLALALLAATDQEKVRCAVALAPITSWEIYASAGSERRLGLPDDNHRGYADSALDYRAEALAGRRLLLVHGSADTAVGVQHSFLLASRLQAAGALFRQMIYPDEGHRLEGVREHLWRSLDLYFHECFLPENVSALLAEDT